jgi:hypothetical protein
MPQMQSAQVAVADFGAPNVAAPVLVFQALSGGVVDLDFFNSEAKTDLTVSVQVSADGITYNATSVNNNSAVITNVAVQPRVQRNFTINLRNNIDNYFRVVASGGVRGTMQYRSANAQLQQVLM